MQHKHTPPSTAPVHLPSTQHEALLKKQFEKIIKECILEKSPSFRAMHKFIRFVKSAPQDPVMTGLMRQYTENYKKVEAQVFSGEIKLLFPREYIIRAFMYSYSYKAEEMASTREKIKKYAEQGDAINEPIAQHFLGELYTMTHFPYEAFQYYMKAANNGYAVAEYNIGIFYKTGYGIAKNISEAIRHLQIAANIEYAPAQLQLGLCLLENNPDEENKIMGYKHIEDAANQGNTEARCYMGKYYLTSSRDIPKAATFLQQAAEGGSAEASVLFGHLYKIILVEESKRKAEEKKVTHAKTTPPSAKQATKSTPRTETFTTPTTTPIDTLSKTEIKNRQDCRTAIKNTYKRIEKLCKTLNEKIPAVAHQALRATRNLNEEIYSHKDYIEQEEKKLLKKLNALKTQTEDKNSSQQEDDIPLPEALIPETTPEKKTEESDRTTSAAPLVLSREQKQEKERIRSHGFIVAHNPTKDIQEKLKKAMEEQVKQGKYVVLKAIEHMTELEEYLRAKSLYYNPKAKRLNPAAQAFQPKFYKNPVQQQTLQEEDPLNVVKYLGL